MKIIRINAIWCSGCLIMKKIWKEIENMYQDIEIINYDYDIDEDIIKQYNPGEILPIAIFYKDNIEVGRLNGEKTKKEIVDMIESNK